MTAPNSLRMFAAGLALAFSATAAFAATAPAPTPFTATYQVSQGGQVIGEAVITLKSANGNQWIYRNQTKGTAGIAAALGANSTETTTFRWNNNAPETVSYDYNMDAGFKKKQRHTEVNWTSGQVTVDEGKGPMTYPSAPGIVDRNTTPYAIGLALRTGKQDVSLPVAVKRNVETQEFKVAGKDAVKVPAGSFQAERVVRSGDENAFSAWYAPQKYPVPVKLTQSDGGNLELQLVDYKSEK
ncbi:Protein of unknown function [Dyella jiangningensis]|uniref:DUF3108 domain-containing protein n=1 Tax=Dyella sp. AtDHG13 TaxID=1938897 RepID=UPI000880FCCC|nr:DUF3108 domain-containing protein [Dyella sp. AtDHG13]PXV54651.1 uncharacterized protein DUF3108 [Dyella sp. AtDHG13]SDK89677.1 Protein of unknown function [Dyella jiangningensis]